MSTGSIRMFGRVFSSQSEDVDIRYFESGARKASFMFAVPPNKNAKPLPGKEYAQDDVYKVEMWNELVDEFLEQEEQFIIRHQDWVEIEVTRMKQEHWLGKDGTVRSRQVLVLEKIPAVNKRDGQSLGQPANVPGAIRVVNGKIIRDAITETPAESRTVTVADEPQTQQVVEPVAEEVVARAVAAATAARKRGKKAEVEVIQDEPF